MTSVVGLSPSANSMTANELPPTYPPGNTDRIKGVTDRLATIPAIERDLEALATEDSLRAEAELNLGYLSARQQRWDEALAHLERVAPSTTEPWLICISHYLRGWVNQRTNHRDIAIAEYRAALDLSPHSRSISLMLADQLAQNGRQVDAYNVLDDALKTPDAGRPHLSPQGAPLASDSWRADPWIQFQHGDAWQAAAVFVELRKALR